MIKISRTLHAALFTATAFATLGLAASAFAQVPDAAQGSASPGRVEENFAPQSFVPGIEPRVEVEDTKLQSAPAGADKIRFELRSVQVDGLSAFTPSQIEPLYADKLGTTVSLTDVYAIAEKITNYYRNNGYILTQVIVPPQTIDGGVVHLKAVEGFIDNITVEGQDKESALRLIRAYANGIKTGGPLNVRDLERHLLLINDLPGVTARSVISPSPSVTGGADMRIIVERDPFDGTVSFNNYGSRYLGPNQLNFSGAANSFFGMNERISAQAALTIGSELAYFALGYEQPLNKYGTVFSLDANHSNTDPGFDIKPFDVKGRSEFLSAKIAHPFIRTRQENLTGYAVLDARNVYSKSIIDRREDHIRAARIGGDYEFLDTFLGVGINRAGLEISKGLGILGASDEGDADLSRALGDPQFFKGNLELQRLQRLTSSLNLLVAAKGQWSADPLLSAEEFGVGGFGSGRGYDPSEITGDDGISGKIELQWNEPEKIDFVEDYQLFSFFDAGKVWNQDATISTQKKNSLTSAGVGVRLTLPQQIDADFAVAFPLTRKVQTEDDKSPRFYFNLSKRF
ncbi:MAG: ShlB/FhaC/HecB family hemolysin secretion/activation protein [Alphaproteobacteria bacterium]|nr:ShlB/FhaC/HecB family hemolysin secretion/activation protein [Alphaproteobacteria bacterium]